MADLTVRDRIKKVQRELVDGALTPDLTRESLVTLTGLLGYIGQEVRESDLAYKRELQRCLLAHAKANRARIEAETSPEYARMLEAKGAEREVVEMIRSCRAYLRSLDEEMRLSR